MLIREAGILFHGIPIIFTSYHRASKDNLNLVCSSGLMSGLLSFAECLMEPVEYFESDKFSIVFKKGNITDLFRMEQEIVAFIVLNKDPRLDKYLKKTIQPLLSKLLKKFVSHFNGCNLTKVGQFEAFKATINKVFGTGTKTLEEKVISLMVSSGEVEV
ncbi:MAG: hypothetical protein HWN81_06705 [Candidatus Lokiarchaeota archaeon]|nr:hypothetical protein [Candidatus Lokiarchaeota archaeon]